MHSRASSSGGPAAVIDIGSNSIRLVVFRDRSRAAPVVFNERVTCGIGRELAATGRLHADGVAQALANLPRFAAIVRSMKIDDTMLVATAATREAEDGAEFLARVEGIFGHKVAQLDGDQEAQLAASGVISGLPDAHGVAADLGGGSLELAGISGGKVGEHGSLPLGPLRLAASGLDGDELEGYIDEVLARFAWVGGALDGGAIYAVGGAWRALARLHMVQTKYPLRVIHNYQMSGRDTADFCGVVAGLGVESLSRIRVVPRARVATLSTAALVLERLIRTSKAGTVVFSANGIREGSQFDALDADTRAADPLIVACEHLAARESRALGTGTALFDWVSPLFEGEDNDLRRLRRAACLLADIGWHEHPDYRAEQVYFRILRLPLVALNHVHKTMIALAVFRRYSGSKRGATLRVANALLGPDETDWARRLGSALRLAETFTGGNTGLLKGANLKLDARQLTLTLGPGQADLFGDLVRTRFGALAKAFGVSGVIEGEGLREVVGKG
ncbi:MAG: Ppx/GppA phosphatase family protein [Alphaproteobacteria bacterium]